MRLFDHEDFAIKARVHIRAIAVFRIQNHIFISFDNIDNMQLNTKLFRNPQRIIAFDFIAPLLTNGMGMPFHTKAGIKVNAFDVYALFHNGFSRQHGI